MASKTLVHNGRILAVPVEHKGGAFDPRAAKYALDIDRRTCERVVPMQVLVLGLSRTGTISIRHALFELGYFDVYHGASPYNENPRDAEMWVEALKGKYEGGKPFERKDWDQLLGHCMAVSDTPCYLFARDLIAAYPSAKIILSVRDSPQAWYASMSSTILPLVQSSHSASLLARLFSLFLPANPLARYGAMVIKYSRLLDLAWDYERVYGEHNEMVRRLAEGREFLEYNVKEGWGPLCEFLEKEMPGGEFPRRNDKDAYAENIRLLKKEMMGVMVRNMVLVFGAMLAVLWIAWTGIWGTGPMERNFPPLWAVNFGTS